MQKLIAKTLLLLMLITVFGQVMAQPCADMHAQMMAADMDTVGGHAPAGGGHGHQDHCGDSMAMDRAAEPHSPCGEVPSATEDCGQGCTCCPGHCASVLPSTELSNNNSPRAFPLSDYSDITSSPNPESAIKPPRIG